MNKIPIFSHFHNEASYIFVDYFNMPRYVPIHRHDFIEIEFYISGEGYQLINGIKYAIKKGSLVILMPWHTHEIIPSDDQNLELIKCSFIADSFEDSNISFIEFSKILFKDYTLTPIVNLEGSDYKKVFDILEEIQQEYRNMDLWKDTLIKSKIMEIMIYFDRCRKSTVFCDDINPDEQIEFKIWRVIEYIHSMSNRDIALSDISKRFHYSESYLNKMLRLNIGLNFVELLQEVRIRNACSALKTYPDLTITEIFTAMGYQSKASFYRAFQNVKGISPEEYKKTRINRDRNEKAVIHSNLNLQVIYYIHLHHSENLTLPMVAQQFYYNETYLSKVLAQDGMSFTELLHEIRIYHACSLLLTTDDPVHEIGFHVGFDSTETFYRVFKKLRNMSPGEFRKSK